MTAIATSVIGAPAMQWVLQRRRPRRLADHLAAVARLDAGTAAEAIRSLSGALAAASGRPDAKIAEAALACEQMMPTGLKGGIAVPHARLAGLDTPRVAVGLSAEGIDFGAIDGAPSHVVFLHILADVAKTYAHEEVCRQAFSVQSVTELVALAKRRLPPNRPSVPRQQKGAPSPARRAAADLSRSHALQTKCASGATAGAEAGVAESGPQTRHRGDTEPVSGARSSISCSVSSGLEASSRGCAYAAGGGPHPGAP